MKELTVISDAPGERMFMLGNEAIARGAIEAGVQVVAAYPGTPSSEITETLAGVAKQLGIYVEWSTNEKVAFEVALAASICGVRAMAAMKHVGVNVAHDPIMTASYIGANGGLVLLVADDPWMWSSQNEQDTRYVAEQAYLPVLEPSSAQEAKDMIVDAFRLSEEFKHMFLVRSVTRIGHARGDVVLGEISKEKRQGHFEKNPSLLIYTPPGARRNRALMIERFERIRKAVNSLTYNQLEPAQGAKLGVIACGLSYGYALEAIRWLGLDGKVSVLKIGTPHPLPGELVKRLLTSVDEVLVVEELEPFVENHVKVIAQEANIPVKIHGKDLVPLIGELSTGKVAQAIAKLTNAKLPFSFDEIDKLSRETAPLSPPRPPILCPGCPHRASYYGVKIAAKRVARDYGKEIEPIYAGDIGCYALAATPPLEMPDTLVCMGGSFGLANGLAHVVDVPIVAILGDSTFFHSGIPPLINAVYNKARITMVVLDNSVTSMTGFQPHPGTGYTATGDETVKLKSEDIARACGVKFIKVVDSFDVKKAIDTVEKAIRFNGPSLVVLRGLCTQISQKDKRRQGEKIVPYQVDQEKCIKCQVGVATKNKMLPCAAVCPAGNDIPAFVNLVKQGKIKEGLELIRQTNPLPAVLGRVCYHPCETECNRGQFDEAIAINNLERFLGDYEITLPSEKEIEAKLKEKVAIIGSGPAGLGCAYYLAKMGYPVTIFEALPVAGGMMAVGIPEYRLPKNVLKAEIKRIEDLGVEIRLNSPIGSGDDLLKQGYKAVFIAVGAHKSTKLDILGEEKKGVVSGLSFLREVNLGRQVSVGERVVVVGGGNVAMDAARVAIRQNAKQVSILYRRSRAEMPANEEEIEAAEEEGANITYLATPTKVLGDGKVTGVECIRMKLGKRDASGRKRPIPIKGSEFTVDADTIIVATGQVSELPFTDDQLKVSPQGTLIVDASILATSQPGIFAGGDVVTGPAMVADAIGAGKRAANSIDRYLKGVTLTVTTVEMPIISYEELQLACVESVPRAEASILAVADRVKGFAEVEGGFTPEVAKAEAGRCLSCDVGNEKCIMLLGCPATIRENGRTMIDVSVCDGCGACAQVCPYNAIIQE